MKSKPVENTEDIEFYYDVLHEYVAFISRRINGGAEIIQDDLKQLVTMNEDIPILDLTQRGQCMYIGFYLFQDILLQL